MSDFEKWFKTTSAYRMLESMNYYKMDLFHWIEARGEYRHTSVQIAFMTWVEQQAKIDELIYKAKLRESDHRALLVKYQATKKCWEDVNGKCEELKTQSNNMEACYIEKKKQVEACAALAAGWSAITWDKTTHWTEGYEEGCYHCSGQIEEALRGAND